MTSIYTSGLQALLDSTLNWASADIRAVLLSAAYRFDSEHAHLRDLLPHAMGETDALPGRDVRGTTAIAEGAHVIATREARGAYVAVYQRGPGTLLFCCPITPVQAVIGQRVDISWPDGVALSLGEGE